MRKRLITLLLLNLLSPLLAAQEGLALIGHSALQKTDLATLQRLYMGRLVSLNQQFATPLNLPPGHPLRQQFLETILGQNEEQYTAYWLVRRYVGKGTPPKEVASPEEMIRLITATPGAIGYVPLSKVPAGANVIFRR